eukprot:2575046-Pyramimonas_sp.AAC.2
MACTMMKSVSFTPKTTGASLRNKSVSRATPAAPRIAAGKTVCAMATEAPRRGMFLADTALLSYDTALPRPGDPHIFHFLLLQYDKNARRAF